ncbi:MAG: hypothetical protein DRO14_06340, partial [Thermoprotei archaeon]
KLQDGLPTEEDRNLAAEFLEEHAPEKPWESRELGRTVYPLRDDESLFWYVWKFMQAMRPSAPPRWEPPVLERHGYFIRGNIVM